MNWSSAFSWVALLITRPARYGDQADRADMGTAFGLDASLTPFDEHEGSFAVAAAEEPATWERRLVRRSAL